MAVTHYSRWFHFRKPTFGLRLLLLVVALIAVISAWFSARRQIERSDRAVHRRALESRLSSEIRYRDSMLSHMQDRIDLGGPNDPQVAPLTAHVRKLDAGIVALEKTLEDFRE